jgi:uncharacterized protein YigA (DUF484 family)
MTGKQRKTSLSLDERTMKVLRRHAERLNLSMSALVRILVSKLDSGEVRI